ncbi:GNAT family N-acetyltransferase [Streptococcus pseudoporcinus]|uniref:GNAT family N-acetyltransferase n=1 Tax=Streptococcus pseudoporcinus TaxID=361101 RepID=UPI000984C5DF|nr:GNAT family N-acetyltransferase [Streptococcus pseudoporcinus]VUC67722.1 GNAT family acetyltransferase [Streptococcus pseudoporcinus]VUC98648.1 GNAT family acetyltransferase [Streptococcus pseudoporcinus]VUC99039.1 GNAT family acetyltransferase [Streptococcus pseudoporcinus]
MIPLVERKDLSAIEALLREISQVHHEVRPDLFKAESLKFSLEDLVELLGNPDKPIFVYEKDGKVRGHLFLEFKICDKNGRYPKKSLYIDDLCVAQESRHRGIGQKLLQFAESYGRSQGAYHLTLNVWYANQGAYQFYDNAGFRPQQIQIEKML